jgi:hypothetical protein
MVAVPLCRIKAICRLKAAILYLTLYQNIGLRNETYYSTLMCHMNFLSH